MYSRKVFFLVIGLTFLFPHVLSTPNFVVLFADDLGYGDLGYTGHPTIKSPNLDRMASEGMVFSQWYSAYPSCSPSRAALLTGRLPRRSGMNNVLSCDNVAGIPDNETLLSELLQKNNYATGMVGKWHLGQRPQFSPILHGFDEYLGIPFSADQGALPGIPQVSNCTYLPLVKNQQVVSQPLNLSNLEPTYAATAVDFITRNQDKPFFLYMAFSHVHVTIPPVRQWASPKFAGQSLRGAFGDAVEEMDWVVGQILDTLRTLNLDKNTLVFFTSDNGPWMIQHEFAGSAGLFFEGKMTTWEGGIRMPAIGWWPGTIEPQQENEAVVSTMDIFPTCLKLAGISVPSDRVIDGRDISDVLLKNAASPHEFLFFYYVKNQQKQDFPIFAVRYGPYKVHYYTTNASRLNGDVGPEYHDPPLLFNVEHDPSERYPLIWPPGLRDTVEAGIVAHNKTMLPAPDITSQGNKPEYRVCCNWATNCWCNSNEHYAHHSWQTIDNINVGGLS